MRRSVALQSILGFWAFYFAINTLRAFIEETPGQLDMIARRSFVSLLGVALTAVLYVILERRSQRSTRSLLATAFASSVPISVAYGAINYLAFYVILPSAETLDMFVRYPEKQHGAWQAIVGSAVNWYFFVVAWGVFYIALAYAERVRCAERDAARYRAEAQTAQLRALRYQVNPHFLFNTLNSLSALVLAGRNADAERMILNLSTFFRSSLAPGFVDEVALGDEIALQRLYLDIERVRFPDRLRVLIDVPEALANAAVPGLILQPLVENAIKHGVARSREMVTLTITASGVGDRLELVVADDSVASAPDAAGTGTGVRNVCDRLAAQFGGTATCSAGPTPPRGYAVHLSLPLSRAR